VSRVFAPSGSGESLDCRFRALKRSAPPIQWRECVRRSPSAPGQSVHLAGLPTLRSQSRWKYWADGTVPKLSVTAVLPLKYTLGVAVREAGRLWKCLAVSR